MRIVEEAVRDIRDNARRMLETRYSSDSASDSEPHPNIVIERAQFTTDNKSEQRESSFISYESNLFENVCANSVLEDTATHQPSTSRENGDVASNQPVANAEIEAEIGRLRNRRTRKRSTNSK